MREVKELRGLSVVLLLAMATAAAESPQVLPDLLVTGSRLQTSADGMPVTVLDRQTLLDSGHTSLGSLLQSLAFMSGAPLGTSVNLRGQGGGVSRGIETLELRGLGAERTLVLVNGRRFLPGGNGVAGLIDLAMIPMGMVERVEILKAGASVQYGADAVAGVVNIITRSRFEGLELRAHGGVSDRHDGAVTDLSVVFGDDSARGYVLLGAHLFDQAAVSKGARDFSRQLLGVDGPANMPVPDGSSAPPQGQFRTSRGHLTLINGRDGHSPDDFRPFIDQGPDTDRYNFNPFEDLRQEARRLSVFGRMRQRLKPRLNLFAEVQWQQRDSLTRLAPLPLFTRRLEGVSVVAQNVFNPFAEDLADVRRRLVESGPRRFIQASQAWRLLLGLDGLVADWHWDASWALGENRLTQWQSGDLRRDRLALALGPSWRAADQQVYCGEPEHPVPGCVPLNLFAGGGSISTRMLDYVAAGTLRDTGRNQQSLVNANLRGEWLDLPAGTVRVAFGGEYRDEAGRDVPDPMTQAGNTTGAARQITTGGFNSQEIYLELGVPLWRDQGAALDLELGARRVQFSHSAGATVADVALRYQPVPQLLLRAAYADAFRAPNIAELFGGVTESNPAIDDPCADFDALTAAQTARCVDQGVPADGSFTQTGNETPQRGGGNPLLRPEDSAIFTAGLSWRPPALRNFSLQLDYYSIRIDQGIAALGAQTVLRQCVETGAPRFCTRIERDGSGALRVVRSALQNLASETARGLDLELHHAQALTRGRLHQSLRLSRVLQRELRAFPGAGSLVGVGFYDPDNFGAIPRWKGSYRLHWRLAELDLGYALQWIGALAERGGELFSGTRRAVADQFYHDLSLSWDWRENARLVLGIDNLSDRAPPFLANADVANTDVSTYRLLGRRYRIAVELRF